MKETPFYFPNDNYNLFGFIHEPTSGATKGSALFCHPFAEEKLWSHRVFVSFARTLAQMGYTVMRFDFMGHGDSDGHFSEASIETRLSDTRAALAWLHQHTDVSKGLCLMGLRLGASIASVIADEVPGITHLILWEPIIDGAHYMKQLMRINLTTQAAVFKEIRYNSDALVAQLKQGETVNIDGYEIAYAFYEQMLQLNLMGGEPKTGAHTFISHIAKKAGNSQNKISELSKRYPNGTYTEVVEEPFWKEIKRYYATAPDLFDKTLQWLQGL